MSRSINQAPPQVHDTIPERLQRLVGVASRAKAVGAIQKVLLVDRLQHHQHGSLEDLVFQGGDGYRELHSLTILVWDEIFRPPGIDRKLGQYFGQFYPAISGFLERYSLQINCLPGAIGRSNVQLLKMSFKFNQLERFWTVDLGCLDVSYS